MRNELWMFYIHVYSKIRNHSISAVFTCNPPPPKKITLGHGSKTYYILWI